MEFRGAERKKDTAGFFFSLSSLVEQYMETCIFSDGRQKRCNNIQNNQVYTTRLPFGTIGGGGGRAVVLAVVVAVTLVYVCVYR